MLDKIDVALLESLKKTLYADYWKEYTMIAVLKYRDNNKIEDGDATDVFLDKMVWLIARNRFVEARRLVEEEMNKEN